MLSTPSPNEVIGGVDTHLNTHHAAVIDAVGRRLDDAQFPATARGYQRLLTWMRSHGEVAGVGVEGTGSYGAGLARFLSENHVRVVEVDRPDRRARRRHGKSDPLDAYAAANAALSGSASGTPKSRAGLVEAIRSLRVARRGAVKARTQAINQLRAQVVTAPAELREQLHGLTTGALISTCARLRPAFQGAELAGLDPATVVLAARSASSTATCNRSCRPPPPSSSHFVESGQKSPGSCWPAWATTQRGCIRRRPSPISAASHRSRPAAAAPTGTGSTVAVTDQPTTPCTPSSCLGFATTPGPGTTCCGAALEASRRRRSCAASHATSRERSTAPYPVSSHHLTVRRSIPIEFLHEQLPQASPDLLRQMLTTFINTLMSADAEGRRYLGLDVLARARITAVPTATSTEEVNPADTIPALSA